VTFGPASGQGAGILLDGRVISLDMPIEEGLRDPNRQRHGRDLVSADGVPIEDVEVQTPFPRPGKIIAVGMNDLDPCLEQGIDPPREPLIFAKVPSSVVGPGAPVSWPDDVTQANPVAGARFA
jgi:2-keto-4-pentenoate hydratase/2-oxohepta-3-ene-1,7-dioic acid hydratase in catechol pathway